MTEIAVECFKHPRRKSVWSPKLKKYVCPHSEADADASVASTPVQDGTRHPTINGEFKFIFLTAVSGTLVFVLLCLTLTLIAGRQPNPLFEKVIMGLFDLAKIGFGTAAGLLGGKKLAESDSKRRR